MVGRQKCVIAHNIQEEIYDKYRKMRDRYNSRKWSEDEVQSKRLSKYETERRENGQAEQSYIRNSISQEYFERLKACIERSHAGG